MHEEICCSLDTYSYEDVEQLVKDATSSEDYIRAIYRVAVAAPPLFEPRYFQLFAQVLANPDVRVRDAAIFAIGYVGWSEFRNILKQIQTTDTDHTVRESAAIMLDGYERFQIDSENPIQPFRGADKSKETKAQDLQTVESHAEISHENTQLSISVISHLKNLI